jgi:lysophospholipase L1-like esterase
VKLGYPGESTTTMVEGGLTTYPHGSQLSEAVAFLHDHGGAVAFITLDIGFNDLPEYNLASIPIGLERIGANLPEILDALQGAAAPGTPIVGMSIYDPFLSLWVNGPEGREQARVSVWDGVVPINSHIGEIYRAAGLRLADVEGAFATRDFDTMVCVNGLGHVPANVAHVLDWTWAGTPPPLGPDLHANGRGYRVIAEEFARIVLPE